MKVVYCAECGTRVPVFRKALPEFGRIIDLVEPHVCLEESLEPDLTPVDMPTVAIGEDNKYVQKLNALQPSDIVMKEGSGDRRPKENIRQETTSTAPASLLDMVGTSPNTSPQGDISKEPDEEK